MIVAKIKVDGVSATAEYRTHIPAGIIGAQVQFDYAADPWDGLHKTVVFRGAVTKDVITDGEVVTIPAEVVAKQGVALRLGVYGVDADGNIAIPTLWADLGNVRDAADPSGDPSTDPSLPVWAKLQAMIGDLDALDTVAKNNLVAAINEAMTKGGGTVDEAEIQRIVEEYLAANPPTVTETDPTIPAWAKQPKKPTYTADEVHALPDTYTPPNQTAQQVGADPAGTAASAVSQHNTDTAAHNDLRLALQELANRVNAALDSDDTTLDQMSEVVAYIKSNKSLIDAITTSKVSVADIVNDLDTNVADKPLSAAQGVALKVLIADQTTESKTYELVHHDVIDQDVNIYQFEGDKPFREAFVAWFGRINDVDNSLNSGDADCYIFFTSPDKQIRGISGKFYVRQTSRFVMMSSLTLLSDGYAVVTAGDSTQYEPGTRYGESGSLRRSDPFFEPNENINGVKIEADTGYFIKSGSEVYIWAKY